MTSCRAIATAIVRRAQVRATLHNLVRNFNLRLTRIVACGLASAAGIFRNTAGFQRIGLMLRRVPVGGPFPDIADHVVDPVAVGWKGGHWRCAFKAVLSGILPRELPLPGIGHMAPAEGKFIAPGELCAAAHRDSRSSQV